MSSSTPSSAARTPRRRLCDGDQAGTDPETAELIGRDELTQRAGPRLDPVIDPALRDRITGWSTYDEVLDLTRLDTIESATDARETRRPSRPAERLQVVPHQIVNFQARRTFTCEHSAHVANHPITKTQAVQCYVVVRVQVPSQSAPRPRQPSWMTVRVSVDPVTVHR